ncbi:MAG: hypothetical protein R3C03_17640 [Pirellulaceae bacterium]
MSETEIHEWAELKRQEAIEFERFEERRAEQQKAEAELSKARAQERWKLQQQAVEAEKAAAKFKAEQENIRQFYSPFETFQRCCGYVPVTAFLFSPIIPFFAIIKLIEFFESFVFGLVGLLLWVFARFLCFYKSKLFECERKNDVTLLKKRSISAVRTSILIYVTLGLIGWMIPIVWLATH